MPEAQPPGAVAGRLVAAALLYLQIVFATCHDVKLLTQWLDKALVVDTAIEVLTELKQRS